MYDGITVADLETAIAGCDSRSLKKLAIFKIPGSPEQNLLRLIAENLGTSLIALKLSFASKQRLTLNDVNSWKQLISGCLLLEKFHLYLWCPPKEEKLMQPEALLAITADTFAEIGRSGSLKKFKFYAKRWGGQYDHEHWRKFAQCRIAEGLQEKRLIVREPYVS